MTPLRASDRLYGAYVSSEEPYDPNCFLAKHGIYEGPMPPCIGRLIKAHLIPKALLRTHALGDFMWADPVWVWACGGPTGLAGHHGALDASKRLRIPRAAIPRSTERFCAKHGLTWYLERTYR
jgi:hypothetical protein